MLKTMVWGKSICDISDTIEAVDKIGCEVREHTHPIRITINFRDNSNEIEQWTDENGIDALCCLAPFNKVHFFFKSDEDAMAFKLRWT